MVTTRTSSPYFSPKSAIAPPVDCLGVGEHLGLDRRRRQHLLADDLADPRHLLGSHRVDTGEVEAQAIGRHQRTSLVRIGAQHLAQRPVQQVGGGVIAPIACRRSASTVACACFADLDEPFRHDSAMHEEGRGRFEGVVDADDTGFGANFALVADLTTRFAVERRAVENDLDLVARFRRLDETVRIEQGHESSRPLRLSRIAQEFGGRSHRARRRAHVRSRWLSLKAAPPRLITRCSAIAASNPSISTAIPCSRARSTVRSSGKP